MSTNLVQGVEPADTRIGYAHSYITSCLFPQRAVPGLAAYAIPQGKGEWAVLQAVWNPDRKSYNLPHGKTPRLFMMWAAKQIRKAGSRHTDTCDPEHHELLIPSLGWLARGMGLSQGRKAYDSLQECLNGLADCALMLHRTTPTVTQREWHPLFTRSTIQRNGTSGYHDAIIQLDDGVWDSLAASTMPVDNQAARLLLEGRNTMAYDIYVWLADLAWSAYRNPRLRIQKWSWERLKQRFGQQSGAMSGFRRTFRRALDTVMPALSGVVSVEDGKDYVLVRCLGALAVNPGGGFAYKLARDPQTGSIIKQLNVGD